MLGSCNIHSSVATAKNGIYTHRVGLPLPASLLVFSSPTPWSHWLHPSCALLSLVPPSPLLWWVRSVGFGFKAAGSKCYTKNISPHPSARGGACVGALRVLEIGLRCWFGIRGVFTEGVRSGVGLAFMHHGGWLKTTCGNIETSCPQYSICVFHFCPRVGSKLILNFNYQN